MNLYETKISTLVYLLKTQPTLFTQEDKNSLLSLIDKVPNDKEKISNDIVLWYQNLPKIKEAMLKEYSDEAVVMAIGGRGIEVKDQDYRETIKNAIRQKPSDDSSQKNPPKS